MAFRASVAFASLSIASLLALKADAATTTVCAEAPEYSWVTVACPEGYVISAIGFASYGTPEGTCPDYALGSCHSVHSREVAEDQCLGRLGCSLQAVNLPYLGDPCVGTPKRLVIMARCFNGDTLTLCATAKEGYSAVLSAPSGHVISRIDYASYGSPSGVCGSFQNSDCDAPLSRAIVEAACLGTTDCVVSADNRTFQGDPCMGTPKRLAVQATAARGQPVVARNATWGSLKILYR